MAKKQTRSMPRAWAEPETARTTKRRSSRRWWTRAGVAGGALVLICALAVLSLARNTSSHLRQNSSAERNNRADRQVTALLSGIPQQGRTLGNRFAPVTLQVFADLEDNDSQRWMLTLLPAIVKGLVRPGILKIEYRSFKTNTINPQTFVKQQTAAVAAGAQNKLWNYVETFYYEQGREYTPYVTESYLDNIASQVPGLNIGQWHKDRNDGHRTERVVEDDQTARADGIHVTPAYRLGPTGHQLKNFSGSEAITFFKQKHPTTFVSMEDLAKAIEKIR